MITRSRKRFTGKTRDGWTDKTEQRVEQGFALDSYSSPVIFISSIFSFFAIFSVVPTVVRRRLEGARGGSTGQLPSQSFSLRDDPFGVARSSQKRTDSARKERVGGLWAVWLVVVVVVVVDGVALRSEGGAKVRDWEKKEGAAAGGEELNWAAAAPQWEREERGEENDSNDNDGAEKGRSTVSAAVAAIVLLSSITVVVFLLVVDPSPRARPAGLASERRALGGGDVAVAAIPRLSPLSAAKAPLLQSWVFGWPPLVAAATAGPEYNHIFQESYKRLSNDYNVALSKIAAGDFGSGGFSPPRILSILWSSFFKPTPASRSNHPAHTESSSSTRFYTMHVVERGEKELSERPRPIVDQFQSFQLTNSIGFVEFSTAISYKSTLARSPSKARNFPARRSSPRSLLHLLLPATSAVAAAVIKVAAANLANTPRAAVFSCKLPPSDVARSCFSVAFAARVRGENKQRPPPRRVLPLLCAPSSIADLPTVFPTILLRSNVLSTLISSSHLIHSLPFLLFSATPSLLIHLMCTLILKRKKTELVICPIMFSPPR
ncbi:hypothetical protein L596_027304 [Steinernema carpocapsae]|uniref:Uncharacterized protein n=1 Tax=Steinernema carpocapsae TaxID=34508 RepID=A0A4U5M3Y4_STECR|nr:hypothetical protein L596_027304 [Steinernema carpocapsae]